MWTLPLSGNNAWTHHAWDEDSGKAGNLSTNYPTKRHSHAVCTCPERESIFVVGGISKDDTSLCEDALWEYRYISKNGLPAWKRWTEFESVGRKVGHKILFYGQCLHVIGGYGNDSDTSLGTFITTLNFDTSEVKHFQLVRNPQFLRYVF